MNITKSQTTVKPEGKVYRNSGNPVVLSSVESKAVHILDVGCGAGDNAKILKESGRVVDGVTISEEEAREAQDHCRRVILFDLESGLPPGLDDGYDAVICSHVLEHIRYPQKLLSDIRAKLREPHSHLIVALPNFLHYTNRFKILVGKFEYTEGGIMDYTHVRWYTFQTALILLESNGFVVERAWVDGSFPGHSYIPWLSPRLLSALNKTLIGLSKGFFGSQLLYIAKSL